MDELDKDLRFDLKHARGLSVERWRAYKQWMMRVDALIFKEYGIGVDEGSDWPSRDTFDLGVSPENGVEVWLEWQDINF